MPTNHKPIIKGTDNGIWRRLDLIPFERNFDKDPTVVKDPDRKENIKREKEGVLALLVRFAMVYQKVGLVQPEGVRAAREAYRSEMDLLSEWIDDCCEVGDGHSVESSSLWKSWEVYAKDRGVLHYVRSSVALGRRLDARFPSQKGAKGVRMRKGIRLNDFFRLENEEKVAGVAGEGLF